MNDQDFIARLKLLGFESKAPAFNAVGVFRLTGPKQCTVYIDQYPNGTFMYYRVVTVSPPGWIPTCEQERLLDQSRPLTKNYNTTNPESALKVVIGELSQEVRV